MSVTLNPGALSNPMPKPWIVGVVIIVLVLSRPAAQIADAYASALALTSALAGLGTAATYRSHRKPHMIARGHVSR
ncbi:hypothetical protein GCM10010275_07800 [Streptomyces litmocidini]|nr:hypothetical protein GCM10010275_07800 [Streptomyces litmocidini]